METEGPIHVLIVHHQDLVAEGLAARLAAEPDLTVVGHCASGRAAVARAQSLHPDVMLIDYSLPGPMGCVETVMQTRHAAPRCRAIILSDIAEGDVILRAFQAGAANYVLKDVTASRLIECIREAGRHQVTLDPYVTHLLVRQLAEDEVGPKSPPTRTELEVAQLLVDGRSNDQMAAELAMGMSSVKRHVASVYAKLNVTTRRAAAKEAVRRGWVVPR